MGKRRPKLTETSGSITIRPGASKAEFEKAMESYLTPGYCVYEGGLPALEETSELLGEFRISFDIRVSCDRDGIIYLEIGPEGSKKHFSFPFRDADILGALKAALMFAARLEKHLVYSGIYTLYWALLRSMDTNEGRRSDALRKIRADLDSTFKRIFKPKRLKESGTETFGTITVTKYKHVEVGRNPKSEEQREKERKVFVKKVFGALDVIESEGGKRTQLDVGAIIFESEPAADGQSRVRHSLKTYGLKWKDLLRDYNERKKGREIKN